MINAAYPVLLTALHLRQRDLCSCILVARDFARAEQDALYCHPVVPPPHKTSKSDQIFTMLRTILHNATLAAKVRHSELYRRLDNRRHHRPAVRHVAANTSALSIATPHRYGSIIGGASMLICKSV